MSVFTIPTKTLAAPSQFSAMWTGSNYLTSPTGRFKNWPRVVFRGDISNSARVHSSFLLIAPLQNRSSSSITSRAARNANGMCQTLASRRMRMRSCLVHYCQHLSVKNLIHSLGEMPIRSCNARRHPIATSRRTISHPRMPYGTGTRARPSPSAYALLLGNMHAESCAHHCRLRHLVRNAHEMNCRSRGVAPSRRDQRAPTPATR